MMRLSNLFKQLTRNLSSQKYVPKHEKPQENDIQKLREFLQNKPGILVLTGAGISTESGIPDYRSEGVGLYARSNYRPIQYPEFIKSSQLRKRYWARNFIGWPRFSGVEPSKTHQVLSKLERDLRISGLITQNVDSLHSKAGSKSVIEMHGSGYRVICLGCDYSIPRHDFQMILTQLNPNIQDTSTMVRPDGDIDISQETIDNFNLPACPNCGGNLKPDIVFFGENIPLKRIEKIVSMICSSDGVLVLGSSLTVFSGYRIVLQAKEIGLPVAIVNIGQTRADNKVDLKVSAKCGDIITEIFK